MRNQKRIGRAVASGRALRVWVWGLLSSTGRCREDLRLVTGVTIWSTEVKWGSQTSGGVGAWEPARIPRAPYVLKERLWAGAQQCDSTSRPGHLHTCSMETWAPGRSSRR